MTDSRPDDPQDVPAQDSSQLDSQEHWGSLLRNTGLVLTVAVMLWLAFNVRLPSLSGLHATIEAWGWLGPLVFIGLYALVAITPIPVTVMAVVAGLLFGVAIGSVLSVIGVLIGCWGAYWLARAVGRDTTRRLLGRHRATIERHLSYAGFQTVFMLRLLPGFPYWPVNYGSGAFGVSQHAYLSASALAVLPGQISLVAIGAFVAEQSILNGAVVVLSWIAVIVLTIWSYRRWKLARRHSSDDEADGDDTMS